LRPLHEKQLCPVVPVRILLSFKINFGFSWFFTPTYLYKLSALKSHSCDASTKMSKSEHCYITSHLHHRVAASD